ncbi:MAG: HAMP domain-containing sensor histidine kinase [Candidatus Manganitrophus sp.]|nr:HAMP domain-containing sensor histidine kinase [Candidatus Manganitrophus sp.]
MDIPPVIAAVIDTLRPAASAKGIQVHTVLDSSIGPVLADPDRLQQVIWNLLSNAIKFTPDAGEVEVRLERVDPYVELSVKDTGIGISSDFLPYVFDRFRQAEGEQHTKPGRTRPRSCDCPAFGGVAWGNGLCRKPRPRARSNLQGKTSDPRRSDQTRRVTAAPFFRSNGRVPPLSEGIGRSPGPSRRR